MEYNIYFKNKKILLAEDELSNQELMIDIFESLGCEAVDIVDDGSEVLTQYKAKQYDLILMDVQMPTKDGYQATQEIRAYEREHQLRPTPILALTANALSGEREKCLGVGMNDYASKPIDLNELRIKMAKLLAPSP